MATGLMSAVENNLYDKFVYPTQDTAVTGTTSPEVKSYFIAITVGERKDSVVSKNFIFTTEPITIGEKTISVEDQWREVKRALAYLEYYYEGRVKYSVKESS